MVLCSLVILVPLLLLNLILPTAVTRSFSAKPECQDKISTLEFKAEYNAASLCSCSTMCGIECGCFGFQSVVKKCRIHWSCDISNMTSYEDGWDYYVPDSPPDCKVIQESGETTTGLYVIDPFGDRQRLTTVYCDMDTDGGGWTVIQRRLYGVVHFNRTWEEFKNGFGSLAASHWIGNDVIHQLTTRQRNSLYVSFTFNNASIYYQKYGEFSIGDESTNYQLHLAGPTIGSLGDHMVNTGLARSSLHGMPFSTLDRDNDNYSGHCSAKYSGGWWFNNCHDAFLNGPWPPENWHDPWYPTIKDSSDIAEVRMMIKPA